jgi:hypoxanthine phosphoribosyltransferase
MMERIMSGEIFNSIVGIIGMTCGLLSLYLAYGPKIPKILSSEKLRVGFIYITIPCIVWLFMISEFSIQFGKGNIVRFDPRIIIIIISILLIRSLVKRIQLPQFQKTITVMSKNDPNIKIDIKKLNQDSDKERVDLSWTTFVESIRILKKEKFMSGGEYPDIIFGINEAGVMIATYLSYFIEGRPPVGVIKTKSKFKNNKHRQIIQFDCPNGVVPQFDKKIISFETVLNPKIIAIVDSEIKTGNSSELIIKILKKRYPNSKFMYVCLGGVIKPEDRGKPIDDIKYFGWNIGNKKNKPDFMVFCVDSPGFESPDGIR